MALARCWCCLWVTLPVAVLRWPGLLAAEQLVQVEVFVEQRPAVSALLHGRVVQPAPGRPAVSALLHGRVVQPAPGSRSSESRQELEGELVLIQEDPKRSEGNVQDYSPEKEPWIGLVPVEVDDNSTRNQESFSDDMVNKMKRALVLGASALIVLALNQNAVRETDLSEVLEKPVIVIHKADNVSELTAALLRGLQATVKITYKTILQDNLGTTLTLWSSCGPSRGGRYGELQGVVCTGHTHSQVQQYLQQLWDTVLLVSLILSTGLIVQARWYHHNHNLELCPQQDVLKRLLSLKTKTYQLSPASQPVETDICVVCLEPFTPNQCLRVLPCLHEYHRDCVDPWLLLHHTCPLCKRSILGSVYRDSECPPRLR